MSRANDREDFEVSVRIRLLERDADEFEAKLEKHAKSFEAKLDKATSGVDSLKRYMFALLLSITTGSVVLVIDVISRSGG